MLQISERPSVNEGAAGDGLANPSSPLLELFQFARDVLLQQWAIVISVTTVIVALAAVYVLITPPTYTAQATLFLDRGKVQLFRQVGGAGADGGVDAGAIDSQTQLIKSEVVALAVIRKLKLIDDLESIGPAPGPWVAVRNLLYGHHDISEADQLRAALDRTLGAVRVANRTSYVIEIAAQSTKPERAAEIANGFADSYIEDQRKTRHQESLQAGAWLKDRIAALRDEISLAEAKVEQFKAQNKIVAAGGHLMSDQQLAELNTKLVMARERTVEARARLDRIRTVALSGGPDAPITATIADELTNPIIVKLREQYLTLANREADWSRRFGSEHLAVVNLRRQIRELRTGLADELRRISETYASDYEIAKRRQAEIEKIVADAVSKSQESNQAQITLRQLESSAATLRTLYSTALQRNAELTEQQSFTGSEARIINPASPPFAKSSPRTIPILLMSIAGGLLLGFGAGALATSLNRVFRTPAQIEAHLGVNFVTIAPVVEPTKSYQTQPAGAPQTIRRDGSALWQSVDLPFSRFAEALHSIRGTVQANGAIKSHQVLGFTSSLPKEGKTTIAAAFALSAARAGASVILVDCDLRRPALSTTLAPQAKCGLLEVIAGEQTLKQALWTEPATGLEFLPSVRTTRGKHPSEVLSASAFQALFDELRQKYDWVVVDLPPLAPIVDVRWLSRVVDSYVFVVEWGRTKVALAQQALVTAPLVQEKIVGAVLNKTDIDLLGRYDFDSAGYYSTKEYAPYWDEKRKS